MPEDIYIWPIITVLFFHFTEDISELSYENLKMYDFPLSDYNPIQSTSRNTL